MNKWVELVLGLFLLIFAVGIAMINLWGFGESVLIVIKGALILFVAFIGILFIFLGLSDLRN